MKRVYCDACEKQICRNVVAERYKPSAYLGGSNWGAEIVVRRNQTWNSGDLCLDCLRRVIAEGREYPNITPPLRGDELA